MGSQWEHVGVSASGSNNWGLLLGVHASPSQAITLGCIPSASSEGPEVLPKSCSGLSPEDGCLRMLP